MSTTTLAPAWPPLPFDGACAQFPEAMYETVVADGLGVVVAGGPRRVAVFKVLTRQRLWFSLPARVRISGFAVGEGILLLQDGAVVSSWSLTDVALVDGVEQPLCLAAFNLGTGQALAGGESGITVAALDALHALTPAQQPLQVQLDTALRRLAWAQLLETLEWMQDTWTDGAAGSDEVWPASLPDLIYFVKDEVLGAAGTPSEAVGSARAALTAAQKAAGTLACSAPVVRGHQLDASVTGVAFVLSGDGTVHALDGELTHDAVSRFDAPGPLRLALLEVPAPGVADGVDASLFYVTGDGAIRQLRADQSPVTAAAAWPDQADATSALPLGAGDGVVWGPAPGGSVFVLQPGAPAASVLPIPADSAPWSFSATDPPDGLLLAGDGEVLRLTAYGPDAHVRDRWGAVVDGGKPTFWPSATGLDAPAPTLVLSVDEQTGLAGGNVGFRIYTANTVDASDLSHASTYPPPPSVLAAGTLDVGGAAPPRIGYVRAAPVIASGRAYLVGASASPFDAVIAFLSYGDGADQRPFDEFVTAWKVADPDGVTVPPLPPFPADLDHLVALALAPASDAVLPQAAAELEHLRKFADGIQVQTSVTFTEAGASDESGIRSGFQFTLVLDQGETLDVQTDGDGLLRVDASLDGRTAQVAPGGSLREMYPDGSSGVIGNASGWSSDIVSLSIDAPASMTITIALVNSPDTPGLRAAAPGPEPAARRLLGAVGAESASPQSSDALPAGSGLPAAEELSILWSAQNPHGTLTQPLVCCGDRLIGASADAVFQLGAYDGLVPGPVEVAPQQGQGVTLQSFYGGAPVVAVGGGLVYLVGDAGTIEARRLADFQPATGWVAPSASNVIALDAVDDHLVAVSTDGAGATQVSGYDLRSGTRVFGPIELSTQSPGAVAAADGLVAFPVAGTLKAINVDFGDTRWTATPQEGDGAVDLTAAPLIRPNVVVAAAEKLVAFDIANGMPSWSVAPGGSAPAHWSSPVIDATGKIVVAANSSGEVVGVHVADGTVAWRCAVPAPGPPAVVGDAVFVTTGQGSELVRILTESGTAVGCYTLPEAVGGAAPVVGNDAIFLVSANSGSIVARSFAAQNAARFDGVVARIDIAPDAGQLDFGLGDFTVEAWFQSAVGGELISSFPTQEGSAACGLRLNLTPDGRIRVAVSGPNAPAHQVAQTLPTGACDGGWHHVALLRRSGTFVVLLDGRSSTLRLPAAEQATPIVGGSSALTIGAYVPGPGAAAEEHFCGLIREVRIWDRALDVAAIQTNMVVELTGREPRLLGLWRLDENQAPGAQTAPANAVPHHAYEASFKTAASALTDLTLDDSAFPYLIHETAPRWPYAGTWADRGEAAVASAPAVSSDGTVGFGIATDIYAVRKTDGKRRWSLPTPAGASAVVADGASFVVMTGEEGLLQLDAATGAKRQIPGFDGALGAGDHGTMPPPALLPGRAAVGTAQGTVVIGPRDGSGPAVTAKVGGAVQGLAFIGDALLVVAGAPGELSLSRLDAQTGASQGSAQPLASAEMCLAGPVVVVVVASGLVSWAAGAAPGNLIASCPMPGVVSGMTAAPALDLLAVATADGTVHGLSLATLQTRWSTRIPAGPAGGTAVNPPTLDDAGRVVCTTGSGAIAVLDPGTGSLMGYATTPQAITTPPVVDCGTAYFGCADPSDPTAAVDGALHSFVFGQTVALRLGVDAQGTPLAQPTAHAVVEADAAGAALHLMDLTTSCVEAWVNLPAASGGGGVLGVCPTPGGFGLDLSIDRDGTIRYDARSFVDGAWSGVQLAAPSAIGDGAWHHVAISRDGTRDAVVYVDGQPLTGVTTTASTSAPAATLPGLKAYLGATVADDLSATQALCGMIGEVRVWDTYLQSSEIAARMHVKLRGDEPDLVAFWDFDRGAVHDGARQGHDGVLAGATDAAPSWWLTDLAFSQPSYPFVTASASITQVGQPDGTGAAQDTVYLLGLAVKRADGTGLPDSDLVLSYVRHDDTDPATIVIAGTTVTGLSPGQAAADPPPGTAYSVTVASRADGSAAVSVTTSQDGHGPAIDVHASFMPTNERFHVSCLLDNQVLAKPAPPTLQAQTKLMQEYHYSPGNVIDDTRDRTTHRVVLTAANANGTPRSAEQVTLWASSDLELEVAGTPTTVNADTSADFVTNARGQLTVVIAADGFSVPTLYARAGFMHRNDRILVAPDDDAHQQLSGVTSSSLTTPKVANWKPGNTAVQQSILSGDYATHADDVAQAVHHVMSSVTPTAPAPTLAAAAPGSLPAPTDDFADMRQPFVAGRADQATVYRTTAHVLRRPPVDADNLRASLDGNAGFVFEAGATPAGFRFALLPDQAAVDGENGPPRPPRMIVGGIFGSVWDGIKDAADDVYDGVTKIVVSVADSVASAVSVAIHALGQVIDVVVTSVEQAVDAVVAFFKQLIADIELLILLLRALLDWDGIRDAGRLVRTMLETIGTELAAPATTAPLKEAVTSILGSAEHWIDKELGGSTAVADQPHSSSAASDLANGVQAMMLFSKMEDGLERAILGSSSGDPVELPAVFEHAADDLLNGLVDLAGDLLSLDGSAMVADLSALVANVADDLLEALGTYALGTIDAVAASFSGLLAVTDTPIDVPFISALYKWITGDDLTVLNMLCLVVGFAVHVVYFVVTRGSRFCDDAKSWLAPPTSAVQGARPMLLGAPANPAPTIDSEQKEVAYVIFKVFHTLLVVCTDASFSRDEKRADREYFKLGRGALGVLCSVWAWKFFFPQYTALVERMTAAHPEIAVDTSSDQFKVTRDLGLAVAVIGDGITFLTGAKNAFGNAGLGRVQPEAIEMVGAGGPVGDALPPAGAAAPVAGNSTGWVDWVELVVLSANTLIALGQIVYQAVEIDTQEHWDDQQLEEAAKIIRGRYIALAIPRLFGPLYTQTVVGDLMKIEYVQGTVGGIRFAANVSGLALHSTVAFNMLEL